MEIASYLGFSSQSYLGQQFKKLTGFTLKEYRDRYGVSEFKGRS
ncbi:MAG: AraC family transcriptional regulator [Enterococcus sp.]